MKVFLAAAAPFDVALGWGDSLWEDKAARIMRMRRDTDKALALTTHRLLCYALEEVHGFTPKSEDFALGPQGKPYLETAPGIHFSLSHSGNMAVCALHDSPVGVDIERFRTVGPGVAERIMTPEELRAYADAADQQSIFFQVWTLKEAYVKYRGTGFGTPLRSFQAYPDGIGGVLTDTGCEFWVGQPVPGYLMAVCAADGMPPSLVTVDWAVL